MTTSGQRWGQLALRIGAPLALVPASSTAVDQGTVVIPQSIPVQRETTSAMAAAGTALTLSVVLAALALGALWWLRRRGSGRWTAWAARLPERVQVVSSTRIAPQTSVHVVDWEGRRYLLAVHPGGVTQLDPARTLPADAPKVSPAETPA